MMKNAKLVFSALAPKLALSAFALSAALSASADITGLTDLTDDTNNRASIKGNHTINSFKDSSVAFNNKKVGTSQVVADNRFGLKGASTSNPLWVTYEFKNATVVNAYRIWNQGTNEWYQAGRGPKDFYFQGSSDNENWTTLDTQSGQTNWDKLEPRVFEFENETAYKYYKMSFTANDGNSDGWIMIQELEYFCRSTFTDALTVVGSPANYGSPSPAYGINKAVKDETVEASVATPAEIGTGTVAGCVGWTTEKLDDDNKWVAWNSGDGNSASFSYPGGNVRLTWNFEVSNRVETVVYGDESCGTVSGGGWFLKDATATLTATPSEGFDFVRWIGDTSGIADPTAAEIAVTADSPRTLKAFFVPTGTAKVLYVSTEGSDENDGITLEKAKASVGAAVAWLDETFMEGKIFVAPGVYEQAKEFVLTNAIEVVGLTGRPEDVILRNTGSNKDESRVVSLRNRNALVTGVVIENGKVSWNFGGNVLIAGDGGTVSNCVIRSAQSNDLRGANVAVCSVNSLVTHCVISNGAMNATADYDDGTAIYVRNDGGGRISNCLITQNATADNTVQAKSTNNKKLSVVSLNGPAVMDNCTIVDNCHTGLTSVVYVGSTGANAMIYNCVIAKNTTKEGTPVPTCSGYASRFVNCVTDDEEALNDTCKVGTLDQMFASTTDGRWRPLKGGLLDKAGTVDELTLPQVDLRGNSRVRNGKIDVGCYSVADIPGMILMFR